MRVVPWRWKTALVAMSTGVLALDIVTGPLIQFPITFVAPVGLGAWYLGRRTGVGYAVALVGCRLAIALGLDSEVGSTWSALVNAGIRLVVLVALAVLLDQVAWQRRTLAARVKLLEGLLPICAFCGKIRRPDGTWEPVEAYASGDSTARFSHGFCESCGRDRYPEFLATSTEPRRGPQGIVPGSRE